MIRRKLRENSVLTGKGLTTPLVSLDQLGCYLNELFYVVID